ncbi:MAG: hypothetical protein VKK97_07130, partial [Synechococcaceae cyanobacterium]|nr:hypothetical protein [Synechococcaceae cyanobacterium]
MPSSSFPAANSRWPEALAAVDRDRLKPVLRSPFVAMHRHRGWGPRLAASLLALPLGWLASGPAPLRAAPSEAEEEANCARASAFVEANAAPALEALERLARQ